MGLRGWGRVEKVGRTRRVKSTDGLVRTREAALRLGIMPRTRSLWGAFLDQTNFAGCRADSVMGVNLFRDDAPHEFGVFTLGLYSMFRLTGGETQV